VAAVVGCFLLLRAGGRTAERRAAALRVRTRRLSEPLLAVVVVVVVTASVAFALAGPRLDPAGVHRADGLGWLPPGLRMPVDGARDDLVAAELDAVTACLDGDETGLWTAGYTAGNSLDDADVATLVADPARAPDEPALAAAALAADNHLAPWVELIELRVGDDVVLTVDRRGHAHHQPSTDADALRAAAVATPEWLTTVAPHVDAARVLRCSARTPL
jgi:hypothetical protein